MLQVPLHGPCSSNDDGDDVNWLVPIRVLDVILEVLVLRDFFPFLPRESVVIWHAHIDDVAFSSAFVQDDNIGPDCTVGDVPCCRNRGVVGDFSVLVLQEGLRLVLLGYIVSLKPVLLAEPPVDDPADVVVPSCISPLCQQLGAAGEEMGESLGTFLAEHRHLSLLMSLNIFLSPFVRRPSS